MVNRNSADIQVAYFRLKDIKTFSNGNSISSGELLIKSSVEEDGVCLYNTVEDVSQVKLFWAKDDEVIFEEEVTETWSVEDLEARRKMIEESWL
jgi:hypothetical protein